MKKLTLFATALAAVFAVSSCSNDELSELNQAPKGKPFVINVANNDGTRGVDITAVSKFNLSGTYGTTNWIPNYLFTKPEDAWVATGHTDLAWPTAAQVGENTHTFYATCDNTTTPPTITDGTFDYTVPAAIADQKDLLVAAVTGAVNETPVALTFKHALSSVKFKIGFDGSKTTGSTASMRFAVNKITLYNIATNGSFNFANYATTPWTVSETPGLVNYVIEFETPFVFTASANNNSFGAVTDAYIDADIYVLPQVVTPWTGNNSTSLSNSYIGFSFQAYDAYDWVSDDNQYYDDTEDDEYNFDYYQSMDGKLDADHYKEDKAISLYAPSALAAAVVTLSDLQSRPAATQYEEVYLPLKMTNGFGFNKTNTLRIAVDQALRKPSTKYEAVFKALDIVIE